MTTLKADSALQAPYWLDSMVQILETLRRAVEAFHSLAEFPPIPTWLADRVYLTTELTAWGISDTTAYWITSRLPRSYVNLVVRTLRHDR